MPIQILPAVTKGPTFLESLGMGLGSGLEQGVDRFIEKRQMEAENEQLKQMGIDLSGIADPKMRQVALGEMLKGQEKRKLFEEKKKSFADIFNQGQQGRSSVPDQLAGKQQPTKDMGIDPSQFTTEQVLEAGMLDPTVGRLMQHAQDVERRETTEAKKMKQTEFQKDREYNTQFSKPIIDQATKTLQSVPIRKGLVDQWRRDIASGETSGLGQYLVDRSGLEFWRNPEAARSKTAAKEYFIEGLSNLSPGTRPNMFIEQQMAGALPTIGRDKESGLSVLEMQNFMDDLKEQYARNVEKIAAEDNEKYGYERKDIGARAQKMLDEYAPGRQEKLAHDIRKIHEDQLDDKQLAHEVIMGKIPPETPMTQRMMSFFMIKNNDDPVKAAKDAEKSGFVLPKKKK